MSALWPQLLSTALVGTGRRPVAGITVPADVAPLVPAAGFRTETDVLTAAGALALARRAGIAAVDGLDIPAPAGHETTPLAPAAARHRMRVLCAGDADVALVELWLSEAVRHGVRPHPRELPDLFRLGRAHTELRADIVTVSGTTGAWLAAQRADWSWVLDVRATRVEVTDERAWTEGALTDRVAYLTTARRTDPARGRALLAEVWTQEPPAERAAMLAALATGLGPDDETFCEAALDDRRKEVRTVAAELLRCLPGSGYAERMSARALACVRIGKKGLFGKALVVTPPEMLDAAARRDGIDPKPPGQTTARTWWFEQIVAAAPIAAWARLGLEPADLTELSVDDERGSTLHRAWGKATVRDGDAVWAEALLRGEGLFGKYPDRHMTAALFAMLPPVQAHEYARTVLHDARSTAGDVAALLPRLSRPWPASTTTAALDFLRHTLRANKSTYLGYDLRDLAATLVAGLPPEAADEVRALADSFAGVDSPVAGLMENLVTTVTIRQEIIREFA